MHTIVGTDRQIYLNKDRKASEVLLEKVTKLGAAAVIFTVDTAWKSKRTRDVRAKTTVQVSLSPYPHAIRPQTTAMTDE